jgi:hypothetical protein
MKIGNLPLPETLFDREMVILAFNSMTRLLSIVFVIELNLFIPALVLIWLNGSLHHFSSCC